ncbi:MAG: phosphoenolpyruvate carboxykinase (GTP), partial [Xanthomonadales bacterium]|nr:phosphoenolpyruvate carboxykinase (GTP) [Xanthomonadales bacterium]
PGFGDNMRVLEWVLKRCSGTLAAEPSPVGGLPRSGELNTDGLSLADGAMQQLTAVDAEAWQQELADIESYILSFGDRAPAGLLEELARVRSALSGQPRD